MFVRKMIKEWKRICSSQEWFLHAVSRSRRWIFWKRSSVQSLQGYKKTRDSARAHGAHVLLCKMISSMLVMCHRSFTSPSYLCRVFVFQAFGPSIIICIFSLSWTSLSRFPSFSNDGTIDDLLLSNHILCQSPFYKTTVWKFLPLCNRKDLHMVLS